MQLLEPKTECVRAMYETNYEITTMSFFKNYRDYTDTLMR